LIEFKKQYQWGSIEDEKCNALAQAYDQVIERIDSDGNTRI
jgi:hypothetical protein